ncbi:malonate decarboxylase subunit epsilon [Dyella sp. 2RAB6]|uniref:malonate decarboxylase subunit epsilon n=1 Tax=Dyella sp. 2RAB6 TaxID=3232992 RepID=UPI003F92F453
MSVLFTFPGQGAQRPGMLHRLPAAPSVRETLDHAAEVLGRSSDSLDDETSLQSTEAVQLCLLIAGVAAARLLATMGTLPGMVCGLSVGAFPAAVIAGVLDFTDALRLVALRGRLMEQAYPHGYGMTAIEGLMPPTLEPLLAELRADGLPVYLANINSDTQLVIAGSEEAMAIAAERARERGARRSRRLCVAVPSHCALLDAPAETFARAFEDLPLTRPRITYLSGNLARPLLRPDDIAADLARNMARPVLWLDSMRAAWERGARLAVEMPPGSSLTRLAQSSFDGTAIAVDGNRVDSVVAAVVAANSR